MFIILIVLGVLFLYCLFRWCRKLSQRKWFAACRYLIYSAAMLFVLLVFGYVLVNLQFLHKLMAPKPVAMISFQQQTQHQFKATLVLPNGQVKVFSLNGDVWQLSAKVLIWHSWLRYLGVSDRYQLDALRSYSDSDQQVHQQMTVYRLSTSPDNGLWRWGERHIFKRWFVKTVYGSAVYMPIKNHARYKVIFNHTSLVALPLNAKAKESVGLQ